MELTAPKKPLIPNYVRSETIVKLNEILNENLKKRCGYLNKDAIDQFSEYFSCSYFFHSARIVRQLVHFKDEIQPELMDISRLEVDYYFYFKHKLASFNLKDEIIQTCYDSILELSNKSYGGS